MNRFGEKTVMVVDDDDLVRLFLSDALAEGGYNCLSFSTGKSALACLASGGQHVDLVLSDQNMPGMTGVDLLHLVRAVDPALPFVLLSGQFDPRKAQEALCDGLTDHLMKPLSYTDLLALVASHVDSAEAAKREAENAVLVRLMETVQTSGTERADLLAPLFDILGMHRFETLEHSMRVAAISVLIARKLGFSAGALQVLSVGSLLHDIGEIGIPSNILMKPGRLTEQEQTIVRLHPQLGKELLARVPGFEKESEIVYSHHEAFDGSGYPRRLAGEAIPLNARIFAIADTLDAVTSNRCYRSRQSLHTAQIEINRVSGSQLDPEVVAVFNRIPDADLERILEPVVPAQAKPPAAPLYPVNEYRAA